MPAPKKNAAAVALGKRNKGVPKTMTPAALAQRQAAARCPRHLPKATIAAAQELARDESTFSAPPAWDDEDE